MSEPSRVTLVRRDGPLLLSIPHLGRDIPDDLRGRYAPAAFALEDTDWHLDRLYAFASDLGASVVSSTVSRYVVDVNRPATGESLYPGMISTSLCPTETFRGAPLYRDGLEPDAAEIERRVDVYWRPYHDVLRAEIARLRSRHAHVLLWEAHSIASVLPRLFEGRLPDFNFGTSDGESCDRRVAAGAVDAIRDRGLTWVLNGRFKGGFITRRYGAPAGGVHALQLEMCQCLYMDETAPFDWRPDLAGALAPRLRACVEGALRGLERCARQAGTDLHPILAAR
jgi:N-formylglutamate deformylase